MEDALQVCVGKSLASMSANLYSLLCTQIL